jgi:hypothetical protein
MFHNAKCPNCGHKHDTVPITKSTGGSMPPRATIICFCGTVLELVPGKTWGWRWPNVETRGKARKPSEKKS